jgi:hypothetical protein
MALTNFVTIFEAIRPEYEDSFVEYLGAIKFSSERNLFLVAFLAVKFSASKYGETRILVLRYVTNGLDFGKMVDEGQWNTFGKRAEERLSDKYLASNPDRALKAVQIGISLSAEISNVRVFANVLKLIHPWIQWIK